MRRTVRWAACSLLVSAVFLSACGSSATPTPSARAATTVAGAVNPNATENLPPGDIPDNQVFVTYSPASGRYSVRYPQGWALRQSGNTATFTEHFNALEVASRKASTQPTAASVRSSDIARLRSHPGFRLTKIDSVKRDSGPAVRIVYEAASPTDSVTGKSVTLEVERYLFWHQGTVITITLSSPKGSDNVDAWKTITSSLVWK